jgi:hypothetical protein
LAIVKRGLKVDRVVDVRKAPRVSVNKLGEYLTATPARRKRIIHDAKYPSTFMVARYTVAENAIADWICSGGADELLLDQAIATLRNGEPASNFARSRRDCCVTAIANAARLGEQLQLPTGRVTYVRSNKASPLLFGDLGVSVRPEVLIYTGQGEGRRLGGIKLYFSKQHPLTQQSAGYITTLLWQSLVIRSAHDLLLLDHNQIKLVDVFAGTVFTLPKSHKQRLKEIAAACEEIAERWDAVKR